MKNCFLIGALALLAAACGGRQTVASKSARAYSEAAKKGPVNSGSGHMHGGEHQAEGTMDHSTMDHSKMDHSTMDHSKMDHSTMDHPTMDHSKMDHSKMDHSKMDHSKMDHSTMDHSTMDHSAMDHSAMSHEQMGHASMDHSAHTRSTASANPSVPPLPLHASPATTLRPDALDAPAGTSIDEANKAAGRKEHHHE